MPENKYTPLPPGLKVTDQGFIPALQDRFRQLSTDPPEDQRQVIVGTHAARRALPAATAGLDVEYFETDRLARYYVGQFGSSFQWVLESALMADVLANQPADLGTRDVGFQFYATDTFAVYKWNGSKWNPVRQVASILMITRAQRTATGSIFAATNYADGTQCYESDTNWTYVAKASVWIYFSGVNQTTAATLHALTPSPTFDVGALVFTTDYGHWSVFTASGWVWAFGDPGPGQIVYSAVNLTLAQPTMWAECDGGAHTCQATPGGGLGTVTAPDGITFPVFFQMSATMGYNPAGQAASLVGLTGNPSVPGDLVPQWSGGPAFTVAPLAHEHVFDPAQIVDVLPKFVTVPAYIRL